MKDPQKEVKRLSENPVRTKEGTISVNAAYERISIQLDLASYPGRSFGSLYMFSPEEWTRFIELMRAYFEQEK